MRAFTRRSLDQLFLGAELQLEWVEEGKPIVHGVKSLIRRSIWAVGRGALAMWFAAETGSFPEALSQNITVMARPVQARK